MKSASASAITTVQTVKITWSTAPIIRFANVKKDWDEYGVVAGQTVHLVRSSKNDGLYYLVVWSYYSIAYTCSCPSYKACKHVTLVAAADAKRREEKRQQEVTRVAAAISVRWTPPTVEAYACPVEEHKPATRVSDAQQAVQAAEEHLRTTRKDTPVSAHPSAGVRAIEGAMRRRNLMK